MSISRDDFVRLLAGAVGQQPIERTPNVFEGTGPGDRWSVALVPRADHRLGSLALPSHRMDLCLDGLTHEEAEAFLALFIRGFLRGGG
jgi:hypothetical protein